MCCSMSHIPRCYCHAVDRHIIFQKACVVGHCWSRSLFLCLRTTRYCWLASGHIQSPRQYAPVNTRIILQSGGAQVLRPSEGLRSVCPHSGSQAGACCVGGRSAGSQHCCRCLSLSLRPFLFC